MSNEIERAGLLSQIVIDTLRHKKMRIAHLGNIDAITQVTTAILERNYDEHPPDSEEAQRVAGLLQELKAERESNDSPTGWRRLRLTAWEDRALKAEKERDALRRSIRSGNRYSGSLLGDLVHHRKGG